MPISDSAEPTKEYALAELRAVMLAEFGMPADRIQLATHLVDDLDLDSIDFVDIAVALEESIGLQLGEEELKSVRTVQDAVDMIHVGIVEASAASA